MVEEKDLTTLGIDGRLIEIEKAFFIGLQGWLSPAVPMREASFYKGE